MNNQILRVIFDSDLRCSHDGLRVQAKKLSLNVDTLDRGEYIIFINSKKNMIKIFAHGNTIAHFKHPDAHKIDMRTIALIPTYFNGKQFQYDAALKAVLTKEMSVRK